jgi:hypothetical protein
MVECRLQSFRQLFQLYAASFCKVMARPVQHHFVTNSFPAGAKIVVSQNRVFRAFDARFLRISAYR